MSFYEVIKEYPYDYVKDLIYNADENKIKNALYKERLTAKDLAYLLSPKAEMYLEEMAEISHNITCQRFGKTIRIYTPIYLSNYCTNSCIYCGFNRKNSIPRIALTLDEIKKEAKIVASHGIKNVILVTGDNMKKFSFDMLMQSVKLCAEYFPLVSIEVPSLTFKQYEELHNAGADGLTMFQETYIESLYPSFHPAGPKSDYLYRLDTPERAAAAGMRFIGLGALLGLTDYRIDTFYMCLHAEYLSKKYWRSLISSSFPRIRHAAGEYKPEYNVTDRNLLQLIFAYRIFLHDAGVNISTREPASLRDKLVYLGATIMSAGSKTEPGGYSAAQDDAAQFSIEDNRSVEEFCSTIKKLGFDPVFKDWDNSMQGINFAK